MRSESTAVARRGVVAVLVAMVVVQGAWIAAPYVTRVAFPPHQDPAEAGRLVAERLGCFGCHGAEAVGGIDNPGSDDGMVPALAGGEMMMWADSEEELREWLLYGRPESWDPEQRGGLAAGQGTGRALVMPAYEPHLKPGELDLLIEYLRAISGLQFPETKVESRGLERIYELGCFRCHGPMGTGGVANPGSLKGYVPGFFGEDYAETVSGPEELREWIRDGASARFRDNPLAAAVLERQALKMPAYGEHLDDDDLEAIAAAVEWLARGGWRSIDIP